MTDTIWTYRTMLVPAALAPQVRALADSFGPAASGMWITGLSPDGAEPATYFISAGMIDKPFADMMTGPEALQSGCAALGITVPLETCQGILGACDVSQDEPFDAMARMGLMLMKSEI